MATELVERTTFGADFDRVAYTHEVLDALAATRSTWSPWPASAPSSSKPIHDAFPDRIINTHPALLPAFKGWHAVDDALAAGVKVTGCTVHVATLEVDAGPILAQEAVAVLADDTEETLHERIKEVERRLYPKAIMRAGCNDEQEISAEGAAVRLRQDRRRRPRPWSRASAAWSSCRAAAPPGARRGGPPVTDVADVTGFPTILGHRVVTLHPKVHGGILADRANPTHHADMADLRHRAVRPRRVEPLPVRLRPRRSRLIDIGGPAMVRAAAKNHAHVGVVIDPADYGAVLDELRARRRAVSDDDPPRWPAPRRSRTTAAYDAAIVAWFDESERAAAARTSHLALERADETLRYGENPHQRGARYRACGTHELVGRRRAARRARAQLPQPVRRRRRVAARARPRTRRAPAVRHHQARQPVRRGGRPTTSPTRTSRPSSATSARRSAASSR